MYLLSHRCDSVFVASDKTFYFSQHRLHFRCCGVKNVVLCWISFRIKDQRWVVVYYIKFLNLGIFVFDICACI